MKSQLMQLYISWHFTVILGLLFKHLCVLALSPQRFSLFTVYLVQWLRGLATSRRLKESLFEFKSVERWKMHFS